MAHSPKPDLFRSRFKALGGPCDIQLFGEEQVCQSYFECARQELQRIESKYSRYLQSSFLSALNRQAGKKAVPIDEETSQLFEVASLLYEQSHGAFDITSGVFREAWAFGSDQVTTSASPPEPNRLAELAQHVGWEKVECKDRMVFLPDPKMQLDLGGIGKEYAADRLAKLLTEHLKKHSKLQDPKQAGHGLINLGGDVVALGTRPDGKPWQLGIQHPRKPKQVLATLALQNQALATSGDYERYTVVQGQRYSHVLNARTGWPVGYWQSVSVIAPSCLVAGSLTSLAMVLEEKGLALLKASGYDFLAVGPDARVYSS